MRYSPSKRYKFPGPRYSSVPHVGTKRWHYVLGYAFGFITFTWILSGLFSMNPGKWSPGPEPSTSEIHAFAGSVLDISAFKVDTKQALGLLQKCIRPKELELLMFKLFRTDALLEQTDRKSTRLNSSHQIISYAVFCLKKKKKKDKTI